MFEMTSFFFFDLYDRKLIQLFNLSLVSHCAWINCNEIIAFVKPSDDEGFYLVNTNTMTLSIIDELKLFRDGHPTVFNNNQIIFDSYPDKSSFQSLYLFNFYYKKTNTIYRRIFSSTSILRCFKM